MANSGLDFKIRTVELIRQAFAARGITLGVKTADPRTEADLPCIAVNRIYSSEDDIGFDNTYDVETTEAGTLYRKSGLFSEVLEVRGWTQNADLRDSYTVLLKEILILIKHQLAKEGFGRLIIKGGRDENDYKTYAPLFINWVVFNFAALAPFDAWETPLDQTKLIESVVIVLEDLEGDPL